VCKINITIKVTSDWSKYLGNRRANTLEVENNIKIVDLINIYNLPNHNIGLIFKNKKRACRMDKLENNDLVEFYPRAVGG